MTSSKDGSSTLHQNDKNKSDENSQNSKRKMNKNERAKLQNILVEYIENPRKMGGCILDIENLFRVVHERWSGYSRHKNGGGDLAEQILEQIGNEHGISVDSIIGPARSARVLACRTEIIAAMYEAGFSQSEIARTINRHPSTILHALKKMGIHEE